MMLDFHHLSNRIAVSATGPSQGSILLGPACADKASPPYPALTLYISYPRCLGALQFNLKLSGAVIYSGFVQHLPQRGPNLVVVSRHYCNGNVQ